ncbi:MAG TPA: hypothetical protein VGJ30_06990 [Candidatus Angelobacter sp.]|jgi:hypothetical protein
MTSADLEHTKKSAELLLTLTSDKIGKLENALEQNWLVHVILAAVGIAMVLNTGHLRDVLAKYLGEEKYNARAAAAVLLPVFLYQFMRLGQLVTAFNEAKKLQEGLLKDYFPARRDMEPIHSSTSFLAESFRKPMPACWPYLIVTSAIVATAEAAAMCLVIQAYGLDRFTIAILAASAAVLVTLYVLFWKSQKDRSRATLAISLMLGFFLLIAVVIFAFAKITLNSSGDI